MSYESSINNEAEARAAFKGLLDSIGVEVVEDIMQAAERNLEAGRKGVTVPTDDGSTMIQVNDAGVSFSVEEWGPYRVPTDTAKAAIAEIRAEGAEPQPK